MMPLKRIENEEYERLTVLFLVCGKGKHSYWRCECVCGNRVTVTSNNLRRRNTRSCGCLREETRSIHDMTNTAEYHAWEAAIQRCTNKKNPGYENYGKRGIKVCKRWRKFENFLTDMGLKPRPELTLDRINNDGNYAPGNCRWATYKVQAINKRRKGPGRQVRGSVVQGRTET